MTTKPITAWWFARERRLPNGDDRPIAVGQTHTHTGNLKLCRSGLHACRYILDALQYAPGPLLCRVQCSGEIIEGGDKLVCARRKYLAVVDATAMLRDFARRCALDVIDLWEAPDIVCRYLRTGDEQIRDAARDAAWVAWDAARDARDAATIAARAARAARDARDAAAWAARTAAWRAQQRRLHRMAMTLIRN